MTVLTLTGENLTIDRMKAFLGDDRSTVEISEAAYQKVRESRRTVENIIDQEKTIYGITTGFGLFSDVRISGDRTTELQVNLIRSHSCGVGRPFVEKTVLTMMVLRLNTLLKGHSGVTVALVDQLKTFINRRIIPKVPEQGSLGASGDLAPRGHLAFARTGEGEVFYEGRLWP